ncbi:hypothetical protein DFH09DRAFT_1203919 [Mycena vulgaris]|nr:hypothetical protein DFH09DRAFT_1203919 [Mycena vulgaris]
MQTPSTDEEVTTLYMDVRRRKPAFPGFAYGYLYATMSAKRRVVAVPYNYGVARLTSVNELFVHAWVPPSSQSKNVVDMSVGRVHVTHFPPGSPTPLEFGYSLFFAPLAAGTSDIPNCCGAIRADVEWRGNILVVKHGKRKAVINVDREDGLLVDAIVNAYINQRLLV